MVPLGVAGPTTRVVVQYAGQQSAGASVRVAPVTPALFSAAGVGSGQGAISNADGSVNSPGNPASAGSVVALFATGLGQTDPPGLDGTVAADVLPTPRLQPSVSIGGLSADVLYAGAAPGMVAGIFQINVRVPDSAPGGPALVVSLQVGNAVSPSGITLAVR